MNENDPIYAFAVIEYTDLIQPGEGRWAEWLEDSPVAHRTKAAAEDAMKKLGRGQYRIEKRAASPYLAVLD